MKKTFLIFTLLFFGIQSVAGQVPKTLNYQGVLTDTLSIKVPDGDYNLTFRFYDVQTGGTALWTEAQTITVKNGIFDVMLGKVTPLNLAFDIPYWFGITIGAGAEMTPRIELSSAAYSLSYPSGQDGWEDDGTVVRLTDISDAVGIGTTAPTGKLHVESNGLIAGKFTSDNLNSNTNVISSEFTGLGNVNAKAMFGRSRPADGYGYGGFFEGGYIGLFGFVNPTGNNSYFGIYGSAFGGSGINYGLFGTSSGSGTNYGVYGSAFAGINNWAGYFSGDVNISNLLATHRYKMSRGASNGYVLTSDATGESNWQPTEGIASQKGSSTISFSTSGMRDIETVTISIPAAGYVVLHGQCTVLLSGTTSQNLALIQIDRTAGGYHQSPYFQAAGLSNYSSSGPNYFPVFVTRTYFLSSPGTYTFRLEGRKWGSSGSARTFNQALTAVYYPRSYGAVNTIVKNPSDHPQAVPVSVDNPEGFEETGNFYEVDLRYYEMNAAQKRAEAEKAERELYEVKLRKLQKEQDLKIRRERNTNK